MSVNGYLCGWVGRGREKGGKGVRGVSTRERKKRKKETRELAVHSGLLWLSYENGGNKNS